MGMRDDIGPPVFLFLLAWILLMLAESVEPHRPVPQLPVDTRRRDSVSPDSTRVHIVTRH